MIKRFGRALLGLAMLFGTLGATGITADAQNNRDNARYSRRDGKWDRNREWRRGRSDNNDRRWRQTRNRRVETYHYPSNRGYNNGRYGYPANNNGRYGNGRYGNGGYNNNNYEVNRGYQQGLETGSSDARRRQSYSPERSRHYRNASTREFLEGFVRGYDQGYRQYAGYNNGYRR